MRVISAAQIEAALDLASLIERLRQGFRRPIEAPPALHAVPNAAVAADRLSVAAAWQPDRFAGIRIATHYPDNPGKGLPAAMGAYLLLSNRTGEPLALIDGPHLAAKCAAATSALAAGYLARTDCERLLMVGAGNMAASMVAAHAAVRPIRNVLVWSRQADRAARLARKLNHRRFRVQPTDDLRAAAEGAHVICCATPSRAPLIEGAWLQPGQHLDLIGATAAGMREVDDVAIKRARVFVDTRAGTCGAEGAGDIQAALASGTLALEDIAGDLYELTRGERAGRRYYDQITLFKNAGSAVAHLVAAEMLFERA